MSKKKYYAVKNGSVKGIYLTWEDCKKMVIGYKNAEYKSFENPYLAIDYLIGKNSAKELIDEEEKIDKDTKIVKKADEDVKILEKMDNKDFMKIDNNEKNQHIDEKTSTIDTIDAYVDGSFDSLNKTYGSGVVILKNGEVIKEISQKGSNESDDYVSMRNVAGEIDAAMLAMKYSIENGYKNLNIHFDYNGIEKWCTGEWKRNKDGTKKYNQFCNEAKKKININFVKVKAHSGDKYNDIADKLAKESLL
ncbi:ribonuclease H1 domain-containing protein [Peptostreptococcus faecalis]|uniref:ribonuclease H1 domain-containing protein n=1 Tax=Peptostreptococcus faecalis TaxID=2045015 RepID=UPI000C7DA6BE|nr:ribonuclease H family protein [Peptostreptococcus faecalis]